MARQLRLRDMGGIIVVDFIDMRNADNKRTIYQALKKKWKRTTAPNIPCCRFQNLVWCKITRERVRPQVNIVTKKFAQLGNGTGSINASILITDQIKEIIVICSKQNESGLVFGVAPFLFAYYTKGFFQQTL